MISLLDRRPFLVVVLLTAYFALQVALRMMLPESLELDEGQQIFLSQWLAAGYDDQPPFYNWVQYWTIALLGVSVFSLTLLKNGFLLASYLLFGLTAHGLLGDRRLTVIAALGLITISQISYEAQRDLTHTVAVIFAASLFLFGLFRTLRKPDASAYLLTGVAIGIGIISKYNFALLPASVLLAMLPDAELRRRIFDWRILLTAAAAILIVVPHTLWFVEHIDAATSRTLAKMTEDASPGKLQQIGEGLLSLAGVLVNLSAMTLVVFAAAFGKGLIIALRNGNDGWTQLIERTWIVAILAVVGLVLFFGVAEIRNRWLIPLSLILPLYLCLKLQAAGIAGTQQSFTRFVSIVLVIMVVLPTILFVRIAAAGLTGDYQKLNVPYGPMVEQLIGQATIRPGLVIAGDRSLAGSIRLHAPDIAVMTPDYPQFSPPVPPGRPVLVVWRDRESGDSVPAMPEALATLVAGKVPLADASGETLTLPYHYGAEGDVYSFSYRWIEVPGDAPAMPKGPAVTTTQRKSPGLSAR